MKRIKRLWGPVYSHWNKRRRRKCEVERLRLDISCSNHLVKHDIRVCQYLSGCCTLCIPTYEIIGWGMSNEREGFCPLINYKIPTNHCVMLTILLLLYLCNAQNENSRLHIITTRNILYFLTCAKFMHWQGLSTWKAAHPASNPRGEKGEAQSHGTYSSSALSLTSTSIRALHTLNQEQKGWSKKQFSSSAVTGQVWAKLFWGKTANLGELCVVALWCRLLSMRDWVENTELIVYAHIDYVIKLTIN